MKSRLSALSAQHRVILKWSVLGGCAAVAVAVDLLTKWLAEQRLPLGELRRVLPFFYLQRTGNQGVAFGLMTGRGALIIAANLVALVVVGVYAHFERRPLLAGIAGGAVIGGSIGNMVQRLTGDGLVTDFMKLPHWPNFNMADVFIDAGIAAIFLGLVIEAVRVWRSGRNKAASS